MHQVDLRSIFDYRTILHICGAYLSPGYYEQSPSGIAFLNGIHSSGTSSFQRLCLDLVARVVVVNLQDRFQFRCTGKGRLPKLDKDRCICICLLGPISNSLDTTTDCHTRSWSRTCTVCICMQPVDFAPTPPHLLQQPVRGRLLIQQHKTTIELSSRLFALFRGQGNSEV